MTPDDPRHGTRKGYGKHLRDGEPACEPCLAANNAYHQRYRSDHPEYVEHFKIRSAAYNRALTRLAHEHPQRFEELYREEQA